MAHRDLIVVGASAGGVEALKQLVERLPVDLAAAVVVVLHVAPVATSQLPAILERCGKLPARHAAHGEPILPGTIYVAPPDHHVLVHRGKLRLSRGPRVNGHRPAIDPLFMSAARWADARVISVILSGVLGDGSNGSLAVRMAGGATIAQDPQTALYGDMPRNAIEEARIERVLSVEKIAETLVALLAEDIPVSEEKLMDDAEDELEIDPEGSAAIQGPASGFACPDCHGALWELKQQELVRYRCRIGHSYGPEGLLASQSEKIEEALWAGYRALEESAALAQRLAVRAKNNGHLVLAEKYRTRSTDAVERARTLRGVLERGQLAADEHEVNR